MYKGTPVVVLGRTLRTSCIATHRFMAKSVPMNGKHCTKSITGSMPMNGGNGTYSYSKNSYYQRKAVEIEREKIMEVIAEKLDMINLSSVSNTIRVADLGCSTGPNTFVTMQNILEAMQQKYRSQCAPDDHQTMPEFQVFFNDLVLNDFNTLFTSLPKDKQYFAAGVPGSFHSRLFPESSIHLVHTSLSLHWLSDLPEELQDKDSPAWNKGRIHYTSAPNEVVDAYMSQFAKEMDNFLEARAKELVPGGMMVMILTGTIKGMPYSETASGIMYDAISSSLMDMVKEGLIEEGQVDTFNLPLYAASLEELEGLVVKNGCFSIERMEFSDPATWLKGPLDITQWVMHIRAVMEGMFARHFGSHEIINQMFQRSAQKLSHQSELINSRCHEPSQLLAILKRK